MVDRKNRYYYDVEGRLPRQEMLCLPPILILLSIPLFAIYDLLEALWTGRFKSDYTTYRGLCE